MAARLWSWVQNNSASSKRGAVLYPDYSLNDQNKSMDGQGACLHSIFSRNQAEPLGNTTSYVTPPSKNDELPYTNRGAKDKINIAGLGVKEQARRKRYQLQDIASDLLPEERVCYCMRFPGYGHERVEIKHDGSTAYYSGLAVCGSVWVCPVCASRITEGRREEIKTAVTNWTNQGGQVGMLTLTLQHNRGDRLEDLNKALKTAWRKVKGGNPWKRAREKYQIKHYITSFEVTYGANGWHPHLHVLFFFDAVLPGDLLEFVSWVGARYRAYIAKSGRYASAHHGADFTFGDEQIGQYLAKWGIDYEMAKGHTKKSKGGISPFELLELAGEGNSDAGALFVEYAQAFKGLRQLTWSRGAKDDLGVMDMDDQELSEQEPEGEVITWLYHLQFRKVVRAGKRLELLEVASTGDYYKIWAFLLSIGVKPVDQIMQGFEPLKLSNAPVGAVDYDKHGFPTGWKDYT